MTMGQEEEPEPFSCHPECLKWSYWRRLTLEINEEISGLRTGQLAELVLAVRTAEDEEWREGDGWLPEEPRTDAGKKAVINLSLRGWADVTIDRAFGFPHGSTSRVLEETHLHPMARDVVSAHLAGDPPSRISRDCHLAESSVKMILASIGEAPHKVRDLAKSEDHNRAIQRRYEEGWSYRRIADHLGISESKVKSRIQYLRRKGRIDPTPRDSSNVRRRRPRAAE